MSINTKWFRDRLHDMQWSQSDLAKALGTDKYKISRVLNGKQPTSLAMAADMAKALGVPLDDLIRHAGVRVVRSPEAQIAISQTTRTTGEVVAEKQYQTIEWPAPADTQTVALLVHSLDAAIDGWVALYIPSKRVEPEAIGRLSVVELENRHRFLCIPRRSTAERGRWNLWPFPPAAKPIYADMAIAAASPILHIRT